MSRNRHCQNPSKVVISASTRPSSGVCRINIGTAAIGSAAGALSLGSPIIEGLSASNPAYVLEGAAIVALLAMAVDRCFAWLEDFARPGEMRPK